MTWRGVMISLGTYLTSTWILLFIAGEKDLLPFEVFFYWVLVTASTVGYGDYSPVTTFGRGVTAFYVIPVGIGLFALIAGRVAAFGVNQWKRGVRGLKNLEVSNHILVIGWNEKRTMHLLDLLLVEAEQSASEQRVVLCVQADIENPMPGEIEFVKVSAFNTDTDMKRACVSEAATIIIDTPSDDVTMTTALYGYSRNPKAHILAYFIDESLSELLKTHCPHVECTPSVSVEMLAKAAVDPGSSVLHQELLNEKKGMTQYSFIYPSEAEATTVDVVFRRLKEVYDGTLIGVASAPDEAITLNPPLSQSVKPGAVIYYIADQRIAEFDWKVLSPNSYTG